MLGYEKYVVLVAIIFMVWMLLRDRMRPGILLFSLVMLFVVLGIITPREALEGFSNRGMITVALLFLVSEGVRRCDALGGVIRYIFPTNGRKSISRGELYIMTVVASASAFLNNTPIVVIFIPHIKAWARHVGLPLKKFLIPLSYAAILGGICTLIGTSTNLVVHGLMLGAGMEGFTMFELGKVGAPIALTGIAYMVLIGHRLLPDDPTTDGCIAEGRYHIVEAVIGPRFPGINSTMEEFDFRGHYNASILQLRRGGEVVGDMRTLRFREGDTLLLAADDRFIPTWGDSSVFLILTNDHDHTPPSTPLRKWVALSLLLIMIAGATLGDMPFIEKLCPALSLDMFFWAAVIAVIMAFTGLFPAKQYTKYISWDILVTIASALAISTAMTRSGLADWMALGLMHLSENSSPMVVLALLYIITNIITELITNNAAAAFAFPVALALSQQMDVSAMPFMVAITIAASCSFSSPIGYQTNMIVQGIGGYRFGDFVRVGAPLNAIAFILSMLLIPRFWPL
ncbi:MAG: SLC13 family permease [Alistipes sp.]|nr:SLC13 family permease [Alistipes sp.]